MLCVMLQMASFAGCTSIADSTPDSSTLSLSAEGNTQTEPYGNTTIRILNCWNGAAGSGPADPIHNLVARELRKKTGVTVEYEYTTIAENEKLNLVFASGDMPDAIDAPFWGGTDACTMIIKKAAKEGLLLPFDPYMDTMEEHLKAAFEVGIAKDFKEFDINDPEFGGKHYILPKETFPTEKDYINWGYNVFARKDILDALQIDPASVTDADKLYDLLVRIKKGDFKDINGKPVIPSGTFWGGWAYDTMLVPLRERSVEGSMQEFTMVDGKYRVNVFSPLFDRQVLYMRRLVSENLIDPECFTQNDPTSREKAATGRLAVIGSMYGMVNDFFKPLYKTHPQMKYVPLGPLRYYDGQTSEKALKGRSGSHAFVVTKSCKDMDAVMRLLNYCNSDEGLTLTTYGIEGVHYGMQDGKPRMKKEWLDKKAQDNKALVNEGIGVYRFTSFERNVSTFGERYAGESSRPEEEYEAIVKFHPYEFIDGFRIGYFKNTYPHYARLAPLLSGDVKKMNQEKCYFARSDEEALRMLNAYREQLIKAGVEDYERHCNEQAAKRDDIVY